MFSVIVFNQCKLNQCKTDVALMIAFSITVVTHMRTGYYLKLFNFTAGIYCLHGKLTAVLNFASVNLTEVKFAPK